MPASHGENNAILLVNKAVVIALFSLTIAISLYASSASVAVCSQLSKQTELCHLGVSAAGAAAAAAVAAARCHFRSSRSEAAYLSLAATATGGFAFFVHTSVLAYSETASVIHHVQQLIASPIVIAQCLRNETSHSLAILRKSLDRNPADDINRSVIDIVNSVVLLNRTQEDFKRAIRAAYDWLDSRGMSCKSALSQPFSKCLLETEWAKRDCFQLGLQSLCNIVDIGAILCESFISMNKAFCLALGPDSAVAQQVANFVDGAIRMRVGVLIELGASANVDEKLSDAWRPFRDALIRTRDVASFAFTATQLLIRHAAITAVLLWPIGYLLCYLWGPPSFDNQYFPAADWERFQRSTSVASRLDVGAVPTVVVSLLPTRAEAIKVVRRLVLTSLDLVIIAAVLALDFYLTLFIDQLTGSVLGSVSSIEHSAGSRHYAERAEQKPRGVEWIERVMAQQLDTLHSAVGLQRFVRCIQPPPPIRYSYTVFYLLVAQRIVFVVMRVKYPYLASMICARFYRRRHRLRVRYLKFKTLSKALEQQQQQSHRSLFKRLFVKCITTTRFAFIVRKFLCRQVHQ